LRLQPEGLGAVEATVTVTGTHVVVELHADNPVARQAIAQGLPHLRDQLGSSGSQATVLLSDNPASRRYSQPPAPDSVTEAPDPQPEVPAAPVPSPVGMRRLVDLRL
jgi:hypothetical protein